MPSSGAIATVMLSIMASYSMDARGYPASSVDAGDNALLMPECALGCLFVVLSSHDE